MSTKDLRAAEAESISRTMPHRVLAQLRRCWLALAVLSWLTTGALYLTVPPSPDQFQHAYLGWRLLEGDVPYRDFIDMNWPGVMTLHALASWIFGVNLWSWRALDFLLFAMSALFLSDLARSAGGRDAGRICVILCPIIYAGTSYWVSGQHDMSAAQFLTGALWFHVRGYQRKAWWWQFGTGLFLGAAILNKPTVGVLGLLFPIHALCLRIAAGRVVAQTMAAGAATVATLFLAACAILARGTPLHDLVDAIYTYNAVTQFDPTQHEGPTSLEEMTLQFLHAHLRGWPILTFGSIPAVFWMLRGPSPNIAATALPVLWIAGILSYFFQWRGYVYHLAPAAQALIGGLAISLAILASGRISLVMGPRRHLASAGFSILLVAGLGLKIIVAFHSLPQAVFANDYARHLSRFAAGDHATVADAVAFVHRLQALPPGECVFVIGRTSSINYLSMRREPTRFYYFPTIVNARPPLPMAERWVELWEEDLRMANCRYTLIPQWIRTGWLQGASRAAGALREFLVAYQESGHLGSGAGIVIYERK